MKYSAFATLALAASVVSARPMRLRARQQAFDLQNGQDALALNAQFVNINNGDDCATGDFCAGDQFSQCVNGKQVATACAPGTVCRALPLVNAPGTSITCTTQGDFEARIAATGAQAGGAAAPPPPPAADAPPPPPAAGGDIQAALTLDPSVIAGGFALNGQEVPADGQVASLTSTNNFINFCAGKTITDGKQITAGSCNPAPMGDIPSSDNIPASKFTFPKNGDASITAGTPFTISMAVAKWELGNFVNAQGNYYSAPQQLNGAGQVIGHSHVVIEKLDSLDQITITNPNTFAFFKGVNGGANNGVVTAEVTDGLPAGFYRLASINAAMNHQPILAPIAQHGSMDDMVYFTIV